MCIYDIYHAHIRKSNIKLKKVNNKKILKSSNDDFQRKTSRDIISMKAWWLISLVKKLPAIISRLPQHMHILTLIIHIYSLQVLSSHWHLPSKSNIFPGLQVYIKFCFTFQGVLDKDSDKLWQMTSRKVILVLNDLDGFFC